MKTIALVALIGLLAACAPLYPHNTIGEDVGEVIVRVVGCPITFCLSELMLHERRRMQAKEEEQAKQATAIQAAYWEKYSKLSPEEKAREDERRYRAMQFEEQRKQRESDQAMQALMMMRGMQVQPFQAPHHAPVQPFNVQPYMAQPRPSVTCSTQYMGNQALTNCR